MIHPKVRLTITPSEARLLTPGLDALHIGLATAAHGDFPDFHAEALGSYGRHIHPRRKFDIEMAGRIRGLHQQVSTAISVRKLRLDLFDIATAQFALRLSKTGLNSPGRLSLSQKLEKYRKRAKRKAEVIAGKDAVSQASETWRAFISWSRFNLVPFHIPARTFAFPRKSLWAQQRSLLAEMIRLAVEEHCYAPLNEGQGKRMVRLIKEELQRGRHPMSLRELLASGPVVGHGFLFKLVTKKMELTPLPGAKLPVSVEASERGERFEAAVKARRANRVPVPATKPEALQTSSIDWSPGKIAIMSNPAAKEVQDPGSAAEAPLSLTVANWLREFVVPHLWQRVTEEVRFALERGLKWAKHVPSYTGVTGLIEKSRPEEGIDDPTKFLIDIAPLADWLFTWVTKLQPDSGKAYAAVLHGYGNALKIP